MKNNWHDDLFLCFVDETMSFSSTRKGCSSKDLSISSVGNSSFEESVQ